MARCKNDALISKIGIGKIKKTTEVDFAVLTDVNNCIKVNTKNHESMLLQAESAVYNAYRVPSDMFNCLAEGCHNSGTLMLTGGEGSNSVRAQFAVRADATDFYSGLVTYYVYLSKGAKYTITTRISSVGDMLQHQADVYEQTVEAGSEGFYPVVVDFSQLPTRQDGIMGWEVSEQGVYISIEATSTTSEAPQIGLSSLYFYNSIEEFEVNDVIKVGCIDEIAGDLTVDPVDASCFGAGYDPSSISIERTVTGKSVTPNYWKLNPLMSRGTKTTGWVIENQERLVQTTTINGVEYGYVQMADMYMDECAFTKAVIADSCNVTDADLNRISTPVIVDLNEKQFLVITGELNSQNDNGKILFHKSLIGMKVIVSYPKTVDIEHFVANDETLDERRVRMSFIEEQTDGVKYVYVYNNVLITSFPNTINNEESTFEFSIAIQRDKNGNFFEKSRIIE